MPRCSSTNQFASYDEPQVEIDSEDMADGMFSATVHCIRPCAECGEDMAEYTFEISQDVECPNCEEECGGHWGERELPERVLPSDKLPEDHEDYLLAPVEWEVDSSEAIVEESGGTRYKKNIFTCSVAATVRCLCCGEIVEVEGTDEAAASYFEVLV